MEHVAILGASNNPSRDSYKAQVQLVEQGHKVYPVSLKEKEILGVEAYQSLQDIEQQLDTITVYINSQYFHKLLNDIINLKPRRVIFNPGSEAIKEMKLLTEAGIIVQEACTLVLLSINQFEEY